MIFITAKFPVKPEHADAWPQLSAAFTAATTPTGTTGEVTSRGGDTPAGPTSGTTGTGTGTGARREGAAAPPSAPG